MTLTEYILYRRQENNALLEKYLEEHPILWEDDKYYGITKDDQNELAGNIMSYNISLSAGIPDTLEWHATGEECVEWQLDDLLKLMLTIKTHVVPIVKLCQMYKVKIIECKSKEECMSIQLIYTADAMNA